MDLLTDKRRKKNDDPVSSVFVCFSLKFYREVKGKKFEFGRVCDSDDVRTSIIGFSKSRVPSSRRSKRRRR